MPHQLVYASAASVEFTDAQLLELLEVARANNTQLDVTGMLLFAEGSFLQVLEGEREVVERLFAKIECDPRHENTRVLLRAAVEERVFGDWSMGYRYFGRLTELPEGLSSFLQQESVDEESTHVALKALYAFRDGRWRQSA